jgi:hypothetical protein
MNAANSSCISMYEEPGGLTMRGEESERPSKTRDALILNRIVSRWGEGRRTGPAGGAAGGAGQALRSRRVLVAWVGEVGLRFG